MPPRFVLASLALVVLVAAAVVGCQAPTVTPTPNAERRRICA